MTVSKRGLARTLLAALALGAGSWAAIRFRCPQLVLVTSVTTDARVSFEVSNPSASPVRILGIAAGCDCVHLEEVPEYPTIIAPHRTVQGSALVRQTDDPARVPGIIVIVEGQGRTFHAFARERGEH